MRLFAGIALDRQRQAQFSELARKLRTAGFDARYVPEEKYHITLAYLGPVDPALLEPVQSALQMAAASSSPFALEFDRIGGFPDAHRSRVAWAGCPQRSAAFDALCDTVRRALCTLGFTFPDEGIPHVTLARTRAPASLPTTADLPAVTVDAGAITLFEVVREKQTSRYERLVTIPLGPRANAA